MVRYVHMRDGKVKEGGIRSLKQFNTFTKSFIIRRRRDVVLPDLPKIDRQNRFVDMEKESKQAYMKQYDKLEKFMQAKADGLSTKDMMNILQYITAMRQITAIGKIPHALEYIEDFLESRDSKLTVFTHHHAAIELMTPYLDRNNIAYLRFRGPSDLDNIETFNRSGGPRVLVASTQSGGVGLNLQYQCNTCLFLERQWTATDEEQAESRFTRIGSEFDKVTAVYLIAIQTIDEWITELIEVKRVSANIDKEGKYHESNTIREIAGLLMKKGRPPWRLPRFG